MAQWLINGEPISHKGFVVGDTQYPANAPDYMTGDERAALGITEYVSPPPAPQTFDELKADAKAAITSQRYAIETGGIEIGGSEIRTDRESQGQIGDAYSALKNGLIVATDFKAVNGWATLTLAEITPIATAVAQHVSACFAAERQHHEAIDALETIEAVEQYDGDAGWPQTRYAVEQVLPKPWWKFW